MKTSFILVFQLLWCCLIVSCKAQTPTDKNYSDLILKDNKLFALTASGKINVFDVNTGAEISQNICADTAITAMSIDKHNNILIVKKNEVLQLDETSSKGIVIGKVKENIYNVVLDTKNKAFVITKNGITDLITRKSYLPDTTFRLNHQLRGWLQPSAVFIDEDDCIWVGSGYGEWGGELFVFDTKTRRFVKPVLNGFRIELFPVKSIFSDGKSVFISCGLQHMFTSGCIVKFNNFKCRTIFLSDTKRNVADKSVDEFQYGEYIGPAFCDPKNNSIYFYSQNGIFEGDQYKDLSKISTWKKIISPKLHWTNGQPNAVGSPMNVLKMIMAQNGNIFLLTQNDGIGVYDGKDFRLLN